MKIEMTILLKTYYNKMNNRLVTIILLKNKNYKKMNNK